MEFGWLPLPGDAFGCRTYSVASDYPAQVVRWLPIRTWWDSEICRNGSYLSVAGAARPQLRAISWGKAAISYTFELFGNLSFLITRHLSVRLVVCFTSFFLRDLNWTSYVFVVIERCSASGWGRKLMKHVRKSRKSEKNSEHQAVYLNSCFISLKLHGRINPTSIYMPLIFWLTCLVVYLLLVMASLTSRCLDLWGFSPVIRFSVRGEMGGRLYLIRDIPWMLDWIGSPGSFVARSVPSALWRWVEAGPAPLQKPQNTSR